MTLISGQVMVQLGGLTITVDSDDTTGRIAQFTVVNADNRDYTLTYTRNNQPRSVTIPAGTNQTFVPPSNGVKWLTDDIEWSVQ